MTESNAQAPDQTVTWGPDRLVWATELLAPVVGVELDPVEVRRLARASLEGRSVAEATSRVAALRSVLEACRLVPRDAPERLDPLETVELPAVSLSTSGLAVLHREGGRVELARPDAPARWVALTEARASVALDPGPWLTVAPATPLEALASHHAPGARLAALLHLERDDLQVVVIYAATVGLLSLATPIAVQSLVGSVAFGTLLQPIVVLSLLLLTALGFEAVLKALQARVVESLQQRVFARAALDLAWRLPRVKPEAAEQGFGPETVNRFFEVVTIQKTAGVLLTDGIATVLQVGIGLLVLGFYHPALLAFDLVLVALLALVVWGPSKRGLDTSIDESVAKYEVVAWLEQLARPGSVFRSQSGATLAAERTDALTRRYLRARSSHFRVLFGQTLSALGLQVMASAALLGLGGLLVVRRELTLGQLVAAELIVAAVANSISKLGKLLDSGYDLLTSVDKLGHLIELEVEDPHRPEHVPGQGAVRVEVQRARDEGEQPVSLEVGAGARVAIVGAQGHRLGEWLAALRLPGSGTVTINGVETSRARAPGLREAVAFVRRGDLFEGTVLENVTAGRDQLTASEARAALEKVGLLDELRALPEGLDTHLSSTGAPLDAGQALRLIVARALVASPRLVVVDESFDGLDAARRAQCVAALTRPQAPWTLVALVNDAESPLARACDTTRSLSEVHS
jgi:ABC-type bacteriocin/lantibiotic exporter with double-glycine peptidase domain